MCPKARPEPEASESEAAEERPPAKPTKRKITRSGAFRKDTPTERDKARSAKEEIVLIGVETSKASRYTFVAPRSGKKTPR